jgi:hypothetical protein
MPPSGLERLEINFYTVTIGALAGGPAPADGHIDNKTAQQYGFDSIVNDGPSTTFPTTNVLALAKERANMRYEAIIRQISDVIQPIQISGVVATGADEDTEATSFVFTVAYDRKEFLRTEDELNLGTFLTEAAAIKRWIERALITDSVENREIFKPDVVPTTTVVQGPIIEEITAGKAETGPVPIASVAVVAVSDVTDTI